MSRMIAFGTKGFAVALLFCFAAMLPMAVTEELPGGVHRIATIETAGNVTVSDAMILARVRSRTGELFDPAEASDDARRIGEIPGVQLAYYNATLVDNQVALKFVIIEKPVVRSVTFDGNRKYGDSSLQRRIGLKRGDFLDRVLAEAGVNQLRDFYIGKGYAMVEVALDREELEQGRLIYVIDEGPRVRVAGVDFEGNERLRRRILKQVVKTSVRKLIFFPGYYKAEQVEEDVSRLQSTYLKRGYLDAQIGSEVDFVGRKSRAHVTFDITEGPVYRVRELSVEGGEFYDENRQELIEMLRLQPGEIYTPEKAAFDEKNLANRFLSEGFVDVSVVQERTFVEEGVVDVEFRIDQGERYRLGRVNIIGNTQTQDKVIRRVLDEYGFKPGEWYDASIADGTGNGDLEKAVNALALTQSTIITPTGEEAGTRDAQVAVAEGQTGMIMLGAGIGSDSGVVGQILFEQRNFDITDWPASFGDFVTGKAFKGAGQVFRISLEPGTKYSQFSVSFTEPYLNDRPIAMTVMGSRYIRGRETYDELRTKGFLDFEGRLPDGWRRGVGFRVEEVMVSSVDFGSPVEIQRWAGDNTLVGTRFHFGRNKTDRRWSPSAGYVFASGYEQVVGDATFGLVDGSIRWYKTLAEDFFGRKTILSTKLQGGAIVGDAPPFEKFYAGGTGSIRGFEYRGVSTRGLATDGTGRREVPVGSDWLFIANAEMAVPLSSDIFSALFFIDSGTIDTGPYRAAVGTGLQILVPQVLGPVPMRFEFAAPLKKGSLDDTQFFSFSISTMF